MSEKFQRLFRNFALFIALGLFAACSSDDGGGGGDDGSGAYTGSTAAADIDADNALELSTQAIAMSVVGSSLRIPGFMQIQGSEAGPCGGLITWDNVTFVPTNNPPTFTGDFSFDDYCEYEKDGTTPIVLSGRLSVSGDAPGESKLNFTTTVNSLLVRDATDTVYKLQDCIMTVNALFTGDFPDLIIDPEEFLTISISGGSRFYHPDHGYVLVSTPTTLNFDPATDLWPSTGAIEIIEDLALPDKAILTVLATSAYDYRLDIDFDFLNNESIDFTTEGNW